MFHTNSKCFVLFHTNSKYFVLFHTNSGYFFVDPTRERREKHSLLVQKPDLRARERREANISFYVLVPIYTEMETPPSFPGLVGTEDSLYLFLYPKTCVVTGVLYLFLVKLFQSVPFCAQTRATTGALYLFLVKVFQFVPFLRPNTCYNRGTVPFSGNFFILYLFSGRNISH